MSDILLSLFSVLLIQSEGVLLSFHASQCHMLSTANMKFDVEGGLLLDMFAAGF